MKTCPYCSEQIQDSAKKCRFCGEFLSETFSDNSEKITSETYPQKNIKNSWKKTFHWTFGIGVAGVISGIANIGKGTDGMISFYTGIGVILASIGYYFIQKRYTSGGKYSIGEGAIGALLIISTLPFFSDKTFSTNPILFIGIPLFLSYYTYPFLNRKITNKWGRVFAKIGTVIVLLFITGIIGVYAIKLLGGNSEGAHSMNIKDRAEFEATMKEVGIPVR